MLEYIFGTSIKQGPIVTEITGLNFKSFNDDIVTQYGTTTPGKYMFRRVNRAKFTTDNFFLLELEFLIQRLLQSKNIWSNRRDIYDLQTKLRTETWIKDTLTHTFPKPNWGVVRTKCKVFPYPTQQVFLESYKGLKESHHLKGMLLDAMVGSGKSVMALLWGLLNGNAKHIIVCPNATLENVWVDHIKNKVFHKSPIVWTSRDNKPIDPDADYYIFHNEYLRNDAVFHQFGEIFKAARGKGVDLVVDECHNFNELSSRQTQNLIKLADTYSFNDTLPMSGTPLKQTGKEAYAVFALIDNYFVGSARERFNKSYGLSRDKLNDLLARRIGRIKYTIEALHGMDHKEPEVQIIPVKFKGVEAYTLTNVRNEMNAFILERIKFYETHMDDFISFFETVLNEYEGKVKNDNRLYTALIKYRQIVNKFRREGYSSFTDNEDSKFAKSVEADIEAGLKGERLRQFRNIKSAVKYVGLKIRGEALGLVLGRARMNAIRDTLEHAGLPRLIQDTEKKTLIFTSYVDALQECERQLIDTGFKPITIYGENNAQRDESITILRKDPQVNPAITTFSSLREGVDVTVANQIIFLNAPWRDYEMKQAKARVYRQGQDTPVKFWLLDLDTGSELNITSRSIDIMEWSREQTDILLGRSSLLNAELRTVMGSEDYDIAFEEPTRKLLTVNTNPLLLF